MSIKSASLLDKADSCTLLHQGGEADVYAIKADSHEYTLKWYKNGCRYDGATIQKLELLYKSQNETGLYRIRESGMRNSTPYLLYDYIQGISTDKIPPMPVPVALSLLRDVAKTLDTLAQNGIHHGDLNPANTILEQTAHIVLIDCGIVGPGALAYAAPERFKGKPATTKSDLYSLGMLLFRWITGTDLLNTGNFDDMALKSESIDTVDASECLYGTCRISANELSALAPLWKAMLRANPDNRAEDFDELDELLEIALSALGIGEVTARTALKNYSKALSDQKAGLKFPSDKADCRKTALPYQKHARASKKNKLKYTVLGIFGLILVIIALLVYAGTKSTDIDATGNLLLKNSRNLETIATTPDSERALPDSTPSILLEDLPTPVLNDQP